MFVIVKFHPCILLFLHLRHPYHLVLYRVQKEAMRQSTIQLEKEGEQKIEKLNNQMDGIIRRTDKEIKNLKNEEANLKKIISDRDEVSHFQFF